MSVDQNVPMQPGVADQSSGLALANAVSLVIGCYQGLVGKDIADSINGSRLMKEQITTTACARITKNLIDRHNTARDMRLNGYN